MQNVLFMTAWQHETKQTEMSSPGGLFMYWLRLSKIYIFGLSKGGTSTSGTTQTKLYGQQNLPYEANLKMYELYWDTSGHIGHN